MIYKTFGSTGIKLSAIGFGGMRFEKPDDLDASAQLVKASYDRGINYFDTAPGYLNDKSETIVGTAIKEMLKTRTEKPFYVATKSGHSEPGDIRKNIENSLKRLNVDCIDFYYVWCVMSIEAFGERKQKGAIREFEKLKDEGLIKHICISTHMNGDDIEKVLADYPFETVLLGYSAMNFAYREKGIQAASKLNRGVVVMNPLGGGNIPNHPEKFDFLKSQEQETVVEAALRFLINDSRITTALVGFSNENQLDEAIKAVDGFREISDEKIEQIRSMVKEAFDTLCTGCQYCDHCPQGIPIPKLTDAYNFYMLNNNNPQEIINRLNWHWGIDAENEYLRKCNECGKCEKLCTQKLDIRKRLKAIRESAEKFLSERKSQIVCPRDL
jgi:predicted aldo/keto reductase-like oxidoreductase